MFWKEKMVYPSGTIKDSLIKRVFPNECWFNQYRVLLFSRIRNNGTMLEMLGLRSQGDNRFCQWGQVNCMGRISDSNTRPVNFKKRDTANLWWWIARHLWLYAFPQLDIPPEIRGEHWPSPHCAEFWNTEPVEKASGEAKRDYPARCLGKLKTWLLPQCAFLQIHRILWDIIYTQTALGVATQNCRT